MKAHDPDIICLQEVLPSFVKSLKEKDYIRKNFFLSGDEQFVSPYGCLILSKLPVSANIVHELPTKMARNCVVISCVINSQTIDFGVVHLESLSNPLKRRNQLEIILGDKLKDSPHAFLMGDFNFGDVDWHDLRQQKNLLDKGVKDLSVIYKDCEKKEENAILKKFEVMRESEVLIRKKFPKICFKMK